MACSIIWSPEIIADIEEILSYWTIHNNSEKYAQKLYKELLLQIEVIQKYPALGTNTNVKNTKAKVVLQHYYLFYTFTLDNIFYCVFGTEDEIQKTFNL